MTAPGGIQRPHCLSVGACVAKTPGKHCVTCAAKSPESRARKVEACRLALTDPEKLARKQAAARRVSADPEVTARKRIAMMATHARPEVKERHRAGCVRSVNLRMQNPEYRETLRQAGLNVGRFNIVHANAPEHREKRGASIRARHLDWCPPEQWDFNRSLKRKGFTLSERKKIILEGASTKPETGAETVRRISRELLEKHRREVASRY